MRKAVAVIGSGNVFGNQAAVSLARELGREIARHGFVLVSGACKGFPLEAAISAKKESGFVLGLSPALNRKDHVENWQYPSECFDSIVFTGFGRGRNVFVVRAADAVVVIGGQSGTLNEFSFAFDEGIPIGVLEGTGGLSDSVQKLIEMIGRKKSNSEIVFSKNPKELVEKLSKLI